MNAGIFIKSTPLLEGTIFENTLLFITELNANGAMGFVINKKFPRELTALEEFKHGKPFPLYEGGPVDQEHLFFIHQRPDLISEGILIDSGVYLGGDFQAAVRQINNGTLTGKDIKIFIGYCGWDFQELEAEIKEGSWQVIPPVPLFI